MDDSTDITVLERLYTELADLRQQYANETINGIEFLVGSRELYQRLRGVADGGTLRKAASQSWSGSLAQLTVDRLKKAVMSGANHDYLGQLSRYAVDREAS